MPRITITINDCDLAWLKGEVARREKLGHTVHGRGGGGASPSVIVADALRIYRETAWQAQPGMVLARMEAQRCHPDRWPYLSFAQEVSFLLPDLAARTHEAAVAKESPPHVPRDLVEEAVRKLQAACE